MRAWLVTAALIALLGVAAAPRSDATATGAQRASKALPSTLGISVRWPRGRLAWFDPVTLRALPGRKVPLESHFGSWAFSADRAVLALGSCGETAGGEIRFVNARAMRRLGDLRLARFADCTNALTWLRPRRLLAVVQNGSDTSVVLVDPVARRILRREPIPSGHWGIGRTRDELVVLLGTYGEFAPARLAVVDSDGRVRIQTIDRIPAGTVVDEQSDDHRARTVHPGLAVDPDGRRAFLVPASGRIAEVDLETLAVSYHELDRPSLLGRVFRWLTPAAQAKVMEGPVRTAQWLGDGIVAVSGQDHSVARNDRGEERFSARPVGLRLIDTRVWTSRTVDDEASSFAVTPDLVIAMGGRWDSGQERGDGPGVRAFGLDGRERWRLHAGQYRWMDPAGPVGYVYNADESIAEVVELATGVVLGKVRWSDQNPLPYLLAAQMSDW